MEQILQSLPMYMAAGIICVVGLSQLSRLAGGLLGIVFWIAVGIVGSYAYDQGGGIGLPGFKFPRPLFYAICVIFASISAFSAYKAWARRARFQPPDPEDGGA